MEINEELIENDLVKLSEEKLIKIIELKDDYSFTNKQINDDFFIDDIELNINECGINNVINSEIDNILENKYVLNESEIEHILKEDSITPENLNIDLSIISIVNDDNNNHINNNHINNNIHSNNFDKNINYTMTDLKNTFNKFNDAILLVQIIDGNIKYIEKKGYESRNQSVIDLLYHTNNYIELPDIQFLIFTNDFIDNNILNKCPFLFTFCKKYSYETQLFPNFNFNHWQEAGINNYDSIYNHFTNNIVEWENKENIIFWTGSIKTNIIRKKIHKASKDNKLFFINSLESNKKNNIPITNINKYKYLLNMNGNSYGGRLNYLFMSGSCVIILKNTDKEKVYEEYFYNYFIAGEDYIEIMYNDNEDGNIIIDRILNTIKNIDAQQMANKCYTKAKEIFEMNNVYKYIHESLLKLSLKCNIEEKIENTTTYIPSLNRYLKNRINVNNNSINFNYQGSDINLILYSEMTNLDDKLELKINENNTRLFLNNNLIIDKFTPYILNTNKPHNYLVKIEEQNLSLIIENKFRLLNIDIKNKFTFTKCNIMSLNGAWLL